MEKNQLLQKRMEMLKKRSEMLKEMGGETTLVSAIDIQSTITSLKPAKKPRKKHTPVVVDESKRRKSR